MRAQSVSFFLYREKIVEEAEEQGNKEIIDALRAHPNFKSLEKEKGIN